MNNEEIFSATEDTKLKKFLTGGKVYSQLAVAIVSALVVVLTVAGLVNIYSNVKQAENIKNLTGLDVKGDLDGQYVIGNAYKFLAKLGYIADSEKAADYFYYLMYIDAADGEQYLTLIQAPRAMDESLRLVIEGFLNYAGSYSGDPNETYTGAGIEDMTGRFKKMSSSEQSIFSSGVSALGLYNEETVNYTLKIGMLPKKSDTVGYWFILVPFSAALIVSTILFLYGLKLERAREEAAKSPYPYLNRKKK